MPVCYKRGMNHGTYSGDFARGSLKFNFNYCKTRLGCLLLF